MISNSFLETERLVLKILDKSYADKILEYFVRNKIFLNKWEPIRDDDFYKLDFHKIQLKNEVNEMIEGRLLKVWIFEKDDKEYNNVIGSIALNNIIRGCFHSCFLGYRIDESKINKGYMTEGVKTVVDYAFNNMELHRIEANIMPHNKASLKVVGKLGFYDEGLAKKYLKINGKWEDHIHMVRLNEDME